MWPGQIPRLNKAKVICFQLMHGLTLLISQKRFFRTFGEASPFLDHCA